MFRKQLSYGQGRRSSAPKRLSVVPETDDKKNAGNGKRSLIPRSTSSRSSSMERDGARSSSRSDQGFARSTSVERLSSEKCSRASEPRSKSTENLVTPSNFRQQMKTPSNTASRATVGSQRTARKDTRPLTDRAFQNVALAKVHEYLAARDIISPGQNISNSMTLKLFVDIMNSLLGELFPGNLVTLSNYTELIPHLMRKLKYPANITRSWLVTANSSHTWPSILGLLSWLVDLLKLQTDLKFVHEDDGNGTMDSDKVEKLFYYTKQKYIEWTEKDCEPLCGEQDHKFFDELLLGDREPLEDKLAELEREVEDLKRQCEDPEDCIAEQNLKDARADVEKKTKARNDLKEKINARQTVVEKKKNALHAMLNENRIIKESIADHGQITSFNVEDIAKFQCEVVSLRNVIKLQDTHITDINNQCYSMDLVMARLQGKLDQERLQRDAIVRKCTSETVTALDHKLSLKCGNEDNSHILTEYLTRIENTKLLLDNNMKEHIGNEKLVKVQKKKAEEDIKLVETAKRNIQVELQQLDMELAETLRLSADLEREINEELSKLKDKQILQKPILDSHHKRLTELEDEFKVLKDEFIERQAKYQRIINRMKDALRAHIKRSKDFIQSK